MGILAALGASILYSYTVIVDALQLRRSGAKIPDENLRQPTRGRLHVEINRGLGMRDPQPSMLARLAPLGPAPYPGYTLFPLLHDVMLRIDERGILVIGTEQATNGAFDNHPQTWACKPVGISGDPVEALRRPAPTTP